MDIVNAILTYIRKPKEETQETAPEGLCALCWGYQEYDGKIRTLLKDKQIDVNNHKDSYMLIQKFVKRNIEGIKLKEDEVKTCPTCGCKSKEE